MSKRGFTLAEILVVLFVVVLMASLTVGAYLSFRQSADLNTAVENVLNTLRLAQSKTLASEGNDNFGVHLETNNYTLFQGLSYPGTIIQVLTLPNRVTMSGLSDVVFTKVTGKPLQVGTITLTESASNQTKSIFIESSGQMGIVTGASLIPDNIRVSDSRHVHFNYNPVSDPRDALTLRLNFSGTIYDINFQDYLNVARDKFDWQNQVLRIHTHLLNADQADFSITRDKRYNTSALSIFLINEFDISHNLINYDSDGVTTQGSSSFVNAPVWQ